MTHGEEENLDLRQRRTRQSLVKALEELLVERPYQSLSVTDICQRAMVHRTTFYAHFNDKQELLRYLLLGVERRCVEACLPRDWSGEARDYFLTAARNVLDGPGADDEPVLSVKNGDGVTYTVPQRIRPGRVEKRCDLLFRVNRICRDSEIVVTSGGEPIARFKREHLAPGEMENIALPRVLLDKAKDELTVSIREVEQA